MNRGNKLRIRYFDRWARLLMQQEPQCIYSVSTPVNDPNDPGSGCLWDPHGNPQYADNSDMPAVPDVPSDPSNPAADANPTAVATADPIPSATPVQTG